MPLDYKLDRIHIEVGKFLLDRQGKLVPRGDIEAAFHGNHRWIEALWILVENGIAYENQQTKGHYALTLDGSHLIRQQYDALKANLDAGKKVPWVSSSDYREERERQREIERAKQADKDKAAKPKEIKTTPKADNQDVEVPEEKKTGPKIKV